MDLQKFEQNCHLLSAEKAKEQLIDLLQKAHAGEKAAANAYYGHFKSLFTSNSIEKNEIRDIYLDELHHRARLKEILLELGAKPRIILEVLFFLIGFTIGLLCLFGGWFIPMYGAGKLESTNIVEYEIAARLAHIAGYKQYVSELIEFAEIEWDHELYFRKKSESHFLYNYSPGWIIPKPKKSIYQDFTSFKELSLASKA